MKTRSTAAFVLIVMSVIATPVLAASTVNTNIPAVPEPGSLLCLGCGLTSLVGMMRKRRK